MNIDSDKQYMVFRKDGKYGAMYSIGLSKKNTNGQYENGYIPVKFRKDIELEDRTNIYIKKGWVTFYLDKEKRTITYIFIDEFKTVEEVIEECKETNNDLFEEFSQEADLSELDNNKIELPF